MNVDKIRAEKIAEVIINTFKDEDVPIRESIIIMVGILASMQKTIGGSKEYFWEEVNSLGKKYSDYLDGANNEH